MHSLWFAALFFEYKKRGVIYKQEIDTTFFDSRQKLNYIVGTQNFE